MSQGAREAINVRYTALAESSCCLSCGGAVGHAEPRKGEVCVDLGSGRGTDAIRMAESVGPQGTVYGIDLSEGMLDKARRTAERLGVANIRFLQGELERLPLEDGVADLLISNCTINHAGDKLQVWKEIHRVLKAGGRFVVSDIYSLEAVPPQYRNDPAAVAECWAGAVTREEYFRQMEEAGFQEVRVLEESEPYPKGAIRVASFTLAGTRLAPGEPAGHQSEALPGLDTSGAGGCCCGG